MGLKDFIRATVAKTDDEGNSQGNVWVWAGTMICLQYSGCSAALGALDCLTLSEHVAEVRERIDGCAIG